jgi:hypothetical protein
LILSDNFLSNVNFLTPQLIQTSQAITIDNTMALAMELVD